VALSTAYARRWIFFGHFFARTVYTRTHQKMR